MRASRPLLLVAGREIRQRSRSRALLVVTVLFATVLALAAAAPVLLADAVDAGASGDAEREPPVVGVLGDAADLDPHVEVALRVVLGVSPELVSLDEPDVAAALEDEDITFALTPDGARVLAARAPGPFASAVPPRLLETLGVVRTVAADGGDPAAAERVLTAPDVDLEVVATTAGVDAETAGQRFAVSYVGSLVLYFALIFFANLVVTGVIEEKGSRVVEVMLPAVPARQLMGGKVLGLGVVGTVQAAAIITPALLVLLLTQRDAVPPGIGRGGVALVVAFVLGFGLYAGITAGLSSLVSRVEDSQAALFPLYALLVVAFVASFPVLNAPSSTLAQVVTFVPFTAPFVVPARIVLVDLPLWQAGIAALGVLIAAVAMTALAARIYEGSILRAGGRVRLRTAWRGARD